MLKTKISQDNLFKVTLIGWVILFVAGCSQMITPNTPSKTTYTEIPARPMPISPTEGDVTQMTPSLPTHADPGLQNLIDKAKADLAQRLTISANEIILLEASSVIWPDASLGCPQEGMAYAQVLTPGYLILLEHAKNKFEYHAGKATSITYCKNPTPPILGTPENT